jgi:hypothetical protein
VLLRDSAQRVYRYYEGRELVIYDFNYAAGDTFSLENLFGNASMNVFCHIDSVDTVHLLHPRKRMYLTYNNQSFFQDVWIEGIGSLHSNFLSPGLEQMGFDMPTYHTRCFYEQDSLLVHTDSVNLACQFDTFAPPSFYFADTTAQWNVLDVFWQTASTKVYNTNGDTIMNGISYQRIKGNDNSVSYLNRSGNKVYRRSNNGNCDILTYDFDMQAGDAMPLSTLDACTPSTSFTAVVDSVDSIYINRWRKRMFLHYSNNGSNWLNDVWVDGIGSTRDLFLRPANLLSLTDGDEYALLCYSENGNVLLRDSSYKFVYYFDSTSYMSNCNLIRTGIGDIGTSVSSIYPNPTSSSFTITLSQQPQPNTIILIHDALGRTVRQETLTTSTQQIDVTELPNGMYTYAISNSGIWQASGKLVIAK